MLDTNKKIITPGEFVLEALAEIEFILISLHKIGSYYNDKPIADYQRAATNFIDNEKITQKLAKARRILSGRFDNTLGKDDMDDIERHLANIASWKPLTFIFYTPLLLFYIKPRKVKNGHFYFLSTYKINL